MTATAILIPIRFCPKCQVDTERGAGGRCKPCAKAYNLSRYTANPDKSNAASAAWRKANADKKKAYDLAWRTANPNKVKGQSVAWRAANQDKAKAYELAWRTANSERARKYDSDYKASHKDAVRVSSASWRKANSEKVKSDAVAWRAANPEAGRIYGLNRRARKRKNGGILSAGLADKLFILQKGKCPCCGILLGKNYHMDHIIPLSRGGPNSDDNIQLLRQRCNNQKHAKHPVDFMQERGFLL